MKKKLLLLLLCLALLAPSLPGVSVSAAGYDSGSMEHFRRSREYTGQFTDVPKDVWFTETVSAVYAYGLVDGVSPDSFAPYGSLTVAECVVLADRLHGIYLTGYFDLTPAPGGLWYRPYINYALNNGILDEAPRDCGAAVTRWEFASILARALPKSELGEINNVADAAIPDLPRSNPGYGEIYLLYRAGVLTGQDAAGSCAPDSPITRCEAAAILLRMADPSARRRVSLSGDVVMYAPDGTAITVPAQEVAVYEAAGYQHTFYCTVRRIGGGERVVSLSEANQLRSQGWYAGGWRDLPWELAAAGVSGSIPVISIDTGGAEVVQKEYYVPCTVNVYNVPEELGISAGGGIRVRGNSSAYYGNPELIRGNSVPYRIKLDSKQNLLGLNDGARAKSWVLLYGLEGTADAVKNEVAFRLGRAILEPDGYYCSDGQMVHVYLNGEFRGSYLLCEQNQVHPERVAVNEPEDGYTGTDVGYLVELDNYAEDPSFWMDYGNVAAADAFGVARTFKGVSYSVKSEVYSQEQLDFIRSYLRGVFKILYEACERGVYYTFDRNYNLVPSEASSAREAVEQVMDLQSFADMYILYETVCDYDVGGGSFFFCVDFSAASRFPRLTLTAPWDFNWICMGSPTDPIFAGAFRYDSFVQTLGDRSNPWFILLYKQDWFRQMIREKWAFLGGGAGIDRLVQEEWEALRQFQGELEQGEWWLLNRCKAYLDFISQRAFWLDGLWS